MRVSTWIVWRYQQAERRWERRLGTYERGSPYTALWMSYEDTIRVADLKIRGTRFERVWKEVGVADGQ